MGPPLVLAIPPRALVAEVLRWSASRFGSVLVGFLANYSGDLVLGMAFSPAASGLYRAANCMVTALADMFVQPAGMLAPATLAAIATAGLTILAAPHGAIGAALVATGNAVLAAAAMALAAFQRRDRPALVEAARLVTFPLAGAFTAGLAADRAFGSSAPLVALALPLACAAAGWLLAAWPVMAALRRAPALLLAAPKPA